MSPSLSNPAFVPPYLHVDCRLISIILQYLKSLNFRFYCLFPLSTILPLSFHLPFDSTFFLPFYRALLIYLSFLMLLSLYHSTFVPQSLHNSTSVTSTACLHTVTIFTTLAPTVQYIFFFIYHSTFSLYFVYMSFKIIPAPRSHHILFSVYSLSLYHFTLSFYFSFLLKSETKLNSIPLGLRLS
jgi:hypothetical protein